MLQEIFLKLNYTHLKLFVGLVQTLQFFLMKWVWFLNLVKTYYVEKPKEEDQKEFQLKEKSKIKIF